VHKEVTKQIHMIKGLVQITSSDSIALYEQIEFGLLFAYKHWSTTEAQQYMFDCGSSNVLCNTREL